MACLSWQTRASASAPAGVAAASPAVSAADCDGEAMPTLEAPYELRCAHDFNIRSFERTNDASDLGPAIRAALEQLSSSDASGGRQLVLFLPAGSYRFDRPLEIPAGTGLVGSPVAITRLQPLGARPGLIKTGPSHLGARVLVEGLHLHNAHLQLGDAPSIVRFNALTDLRSMARPQIEVKAAWHRIEGNVLWRGADWPGVGIRISPVPAASAAEEATVVAGNLIGAVSPREASAGPATRAHAVAQRLIAQRQQSREAGWSLPGSGHYRSALSSWLTGPLEVRHNEVVLTAAPPRDNIQARHAALFHASSGLTLEDNRFGREGEWGQDTPSVQLKGAASTSVRGNEFTQTSLSIKGSALQSVQVRSNRFSDAGIDIQAQVNPATATMPWDLLIEENRFDPSKGCDIMRRPPATGTANFEPMGNVKGPDSLSQPPATVCAH